MILAWFLLAAAAVCPAAITLPPSRVLAGPLDDVRSSMGDSISNYPFGSGVGTVNLHGWVSVEFDPPAGRTAHFRMHWHAVGDVPLFSFASGHYLHVTGEQNINSALQVSQGDLDLDSGAVTNLDVHAIFQNVLIQKSSRYDRLPLVSDVSSFTALFGDFPPLDFPFDLPFKERPATSLTAKFALDSSQRITGFELHGVTFIPITVLPALGIMPPFSFGRKGVTIVPGMEGCLPGTTPASQCLSEERLPDGIDSPDNAYLSPNLHLVTAELRETPGPMPVPPAQPGGVSMGAAAAAVGGRLYLTGGSDGDRASSRTLAFDPSRGEWTSLPDMPGARWSHCAAAAGGKLYVVGGRESGGPAPLATIAVYDPNTRVWSGGAALPAASSLAACAALDARIYVFGGATATGPASDAAFVLDTASGQWSALPRMPVPLSGSAAVVAGREIWIVNGTADGQTATARVLVYSPDAGTWREGPPTTRAVYGASAASLEGRIYLAGGRAAPGGALDVGTVLFHSQTMQVLAKGAWYAGLYPPLPASAMAGGVVGDTWYLAGGDTAAAATPAPTGIVQAFTGARGWVVSDTYPVFSPPMVRNAAGLGTGPAELAPGEMATIVGANLAGLKLTAPPVRFEGRYLTTDLPEELGGIRVTVDGTRAGILAVAPDRIDFQVPFGLAAGRTVAVRVSRNGVDAPAAPVRLEPSAPGIFTYTYGETRSIDVLNETAAIVLNANGTLNYPSQPAHPGETITLRATGLGDVDARPDPLERGPRDASAAVRLPEVLVDGRPAVIQSAVLTPGEAGLYDLKLTIPSETRTGVRVPVQLRAGEILSNPAVLAIE